MKRTILLLLLLALVGIDLFLFESLLPHNWHHPISEQLGNIFPAQKYEPHPNMDWEIEGALRQHPLLRIIFYLLNAALAIGDAFLISKVWKILRRLKPLSAQT